MTYQDAVACLNTGTNYEQHRDPEAMRRISLERMQQLCERLGNPQRSFRSVLISGTSGKGSICAMLYAMLRESRLRVGLYTSPHLEHLRERIRVGEGAGGAGPEGDWITEPEFAERIAQLRPVLEAMRETAPGGPPTYFEMLTAAAFLHFQARRVEVAVVEVGLGGRLDATNVLQQAVSVIAPIGLDHVEVLGADPRAIAREKAGIIKPRQTVITALQTPEVTEVLREACAERGVPLLAYGRELTAGVERCDLQGLVVSITALRGVYESLRVPLLGRHQAQNAACAVSALEALATGGVPRAFVERGLAGVAWPGRLERLHQEPLVLLDGAHNPAAVRALVESLEELCPGRPIHVLLGMSNDKSVEMVGEHLGRRAASITCTRSRHPRATDPARLAERLAPYCRERHVIADPVDAYTYVFNTAAPSDVIVVAGSLFLVGELRPAIRRCHAHASLTNGRHPGCLSSR